MTTESRDSIHEPLSPQELRRQTLWNLVSGCAVSAVLIWAQWYYAPPVQAAVIRCGDQGWLCRATRFFCSC